MRSALLAALLLALPGLGNAASFEQVLGGHFADILRTIRSTPLGKTAPASREQRTGAPAIQGGPILYEESEISRCPRSPQALRGRPDRDLYTYVGFRYVRSDGSTCSAQPSGNTGYREARQRTLTFEARQQGDPSSHSYELATPEYRIRRNFYFRTLLDGTRRFYSHDVSRRTGRELPETVRLSFVNRSDYPLLPWEPAETFRLLYGRESGAELHPASTNYEYEVGSSVGETPDGNMLTEVRAKAVKKRQLTPPEPEGVTLTLTKDGSSLVLDVRDAWARYYKGEKLGLKIKVWRAVPLWWDKVAYELDVSLEAAPQILMDLSDPRWDPFRREAIAPGREYYADWSFSRVDSRISTGDWVEKKRTDPLKL